MLKINIDLNPNRKLFFTSDLHIEHKNILKFCNRPFEDVKVMTERLIENWNKVVTKDDIIVVLGDFFWTKDRRFIKKTIERLNGYKIYLIPGNHDKIEVYSKVVDPRFEILSDIVHFYIKSIGSEILNYDKEVVCSHYPLMTWGSRDRGAYQFFGHIHSNPFKKEGYDQDLLLYSTQYDVGVDNNNFSPISLDSILKIIHK